MQTSVGAENLLPEQVDHVAQARLYGEPLFQMPTDLYIPPDALEIFLEAFEGPLDLLLYLIRKQNLNVFDIPMAQVTKQYLGYIEQIRKHNLELAAEYLLMAALLIEIKSRMLLPIPKKANEEESADPRAELVERLLKYEQMKYAAHQIEQLPQLGRDFFNPHIIVEQLDTLRLPSVSLDDLQAALRAVFTRAKLNQHHKITRSELSVREHMSLILKKLQTQAFVEFSDLFDATRGVPYVVVHLIALLELAKETLIELVQVEAYAPIYIRLNQNTLIH